MPFINNVHPSSWPKAVKKLKLVPTDSIASNGSFYGHVYGSKADSGIVDEHASGMSVGYGETIKICPFEFCRWYFQMAFYERFFTKVSLLFFLVHVILNFVNFKNTNYKKREN